MVTKKILNFRKSFDKEKMILAFFSLYPYRRSDEKFVNLRVFFCYVITVTQTLLMCMLFFGDDIMEFLNTLHFIIINITLLVKLSLFLFTGEKFREVEKHLDTIKDEDVPEELVDHIAKEEFIRNQLGFPQRLLILGGMSFTIIMCLILRKYRPLIIKSWTPFDIQDPTYYYLTLIFQTISFVLSGLPNSGIDIIFYILVDIACAQVDILMYNFTKLDTKRSTEKVYKDVRNNVIFHCRLIRFIEIIQDIYSRIIFAQCFGSVSVICILGFQLAVTVQFPSMQLIKTSIFFISMVFQIFFYCWFGQKFLLKGQDIVQACYMSNWNECDLKTKRMYLIVMARAVKPIKLSAGIFILNLETFILIIRSSYSYMAVLNTMYSE